MAWTFWDPATGETYVPPWGPESYTSPFRERVLTDQSTTSRRGKILTWEGEPRPMDWRAQGRVLEQAHYEALQAWAAKPNRIVITDQHGRQWVAYLMSFAPTPRRAFQYHWSHEYTLRGVIFGRYVP